MSHKCWNTTLTINVYGFKITPLLISGAKLVVTGGRMCGKADRPQ